jgi:uncharacterized membrane protein
MSNIYGSVGYTVGALSGLLYMRLNRQLTLAVFLIIMSIAKASTTYLPDIRFLFIDTFLIGSAQGVINN